MNSRSASDLGGPLQEYPLCSSFACQYSTKITATGSKLKSNKSDSVKTHDSKPVKLDTGRDFLDWLDRMETNIQVEKDSHFNVYQEQINELSDCVNSLLKGKYLYQLDFWLRIFFNYFCFHLIWNYYF